MPRPATRRERIFIHLFASGWFPARIGEQIKSHGEDAQDLACAMAATPGAIVRNRDAAG
jgi:hypothetical protein